MSEIWLSLTNLPEEGQEFFYSEQEIWKSPIEEFELPYSILEPIQAWIVVLLREKGCFVKGTIKGKIALPCSRCAEDLSFQFEEKISIIELLPEEKKMEDFFGPEFLRWNEDILELNVGGILWEQFVLSMPEKPLCMENCLGICPHCGLNKNWHSCTCDSEEADPRLEIFRHLKVKK